MLRCAVKMELQIRLFLFDRSDLYCVPDYLLKNALFTFRCYCRVYKEVNRILYILFFGLQNKRNCADRNVF